ncbi:hypothetical protein CWC38_02525 [Kocuria tytonicola]|nr:hypothetical protein CWC38_02525 [Kocuria tytonicola]
MPAAPWERSGGGTADPGTPSPPAAASAPAVAPGAPQSRDAAAPGGEVDGEWHRVHLLTPFVRSWLLLVALVWGFANTFVDDVVSSFVKHEPIQVDVGGAVRVVGAGLGLAVLCGVLGVLIGLGLLSWWFTRYQITGEHVRFRSGWLFRTQRQARLDRVQGIDVERRFLPRVLGLSSLKFDVADGGSSVLELSYLGRDHARELRSQLLVAAHRAAERQETARATSPAAVPDAEAGSAGADPAPGTRSGRSREGVDVRVAQKYGILSERDELRRVFTVPTARVLLALVCSPPAVVLLLLALLMAGLSVWFPEALVVVLPTAVPPLLGVVSGLYSRLERSWGFTLSEVPEGVRTRSGLFNERSSTIPTGRVQALEVTAPLLWRFFGGHRVTVTTAGKGGAGGTETLGSVVLPVGTWEQVRGVLELVLPLELTPTDLVTEGLRGIGGGENFTTSPRRARWLDPLTWRRTGFAMDEAVLVLRRGRLARHASVVPHHKTQSAALSQGPLERRFGLSDLSVHVTPGSVTTAVAHLDVADARALLERHTQLARAARARVGARAPERPWSTAAPAPDTVR